MADAYPDYLASYRAIAVKLKKFAVLPLSHIRTMSCAGEFMHRSLFNILLSGASCENPMLGEPWINFRHCQSL